MGRSCRFRPESCAWVPLGPIDDDLAREFGEAVAAAAAPIDDVRGTAPYRRHALAVLGRRTLQWAVRELGGGA